ncbi:MAG: hypothetical protein LAT57_05640 [Balneolales bacterium]|nr:hypothetical protein [Balneolales bacterium]
MQFRNYFTLYITVVLLLMGCSNEEQGLELNMSIIGNDMSYNASSDSVAILMATGFDVGVDNSLYVFDLGESKLKKLIQRVNLSRQ